MLAIAHGGRIIRGVAIFTATICTLLTTACGPSMGTYITMHTIEEIELMVYLNRETIDREASINEWTVQCDYLLLEPSCRVTYPLDTNLGYDFPIPLQERLINSYGKRQPGSLDFTPFILQCDRFNPESSWRCSIAHGETLEELKVVK
jgi:hypothetical protein